MKVSPRIISGIIIMMAVFSTLAENPPQEILESADLSQLPPAPDAAVVQLPAEKRSVARALAIAGGALQTVGAVGTIGIVNGAFRGNFSGESPLVLLISTVLSVLGPTISTVGEAIVVNPLNDTFPGLSKPAFLCYNAGWSCFGVMMLAALIEANNNASSETMNSIITTGLVITQACWLGTHVFSCNAGYHYLAKRREKSISVGLAPVFRGSNMGMAIQAVF